MPGGSRKTVQLCSVDFIVELLVQFIVQVVVEVVGQYLLSKALDRAATVLTTRIGRYVIGAVLALGFGIGWGEHLSSRAHWPKLLWVSLGLAVVAGFLARRRRSYGEHPGLTWRTVFAPPWRWSRQRLIGFAVINLALALGIVVGYGGQ